MLNCIHVTRNWCDVNICECCHAHNRCDVIHEKVSCLMPQKSEWCHTYHWVCFQSQMWALSKVHHWCDVRHTMSVKAHNNLVMSQTTGVVSLRKMSEYSHIAMRVTQNTLVRYVRVKCERFHRILEVTSYITVGVTSQLRIWLPSYTMGMILHNLRDATVYPIVSTLMLCDVPKWRWCPT